MPLLQLLQIKVGNQECLIMKVGAIRLMTIELDCLVRRLLVEQGDVDCRRFGERERSSSAVSLDALDAVRTTVGERLYLLRSARMHHVLHALLVNNSVAACYIRRCATFLISHRSRTGPSNSRRLLVRGLYRNAAVGVSPALESSEAPNKNRLPIALWPL